MTKSTVKPMESTLGGSEIVGMGKGGGGASKLAHQHTCWYFQAVAKDESLDVFGCRFNL